MRLRDQILVLPNAMLYAWRAKMQQQGEDVDEVQIAGEAVAGVCGGEVVG